MRQSLEEEAIERAIDDCAFAKIVSTAHSTAILIGYEVVEICGGRADFWAEVLTRSLRRHPKDSSIVSGLAEGQTCRT